MLQKASGRASQAIGAVFLNKQITATPALIDYVAIDAMASALSVVDEYATAQAQRDTAADLQNIINKLAYCDDPDTWRGAVTNLVIQLQKEA